MLLGVKETATTWLAAGPRVPSVAGSQVLAVFFCAVDSRHASDLCLYRLRC